MAVMDTKFRNCWESDEVKRSRLVSSNCSLVISCVDHFSELLLLSDVNLDLWQKYPFFTHSEPLRSPYRLFPRAVIKFVSELLDVSRIYWFPDRRFLLLVWIMWSDTAAVWCWDDAPSFNYWDVIGWSQSAFTYDVLTYCSFLYWSLEQVSKTCFEML